MNSVHKLASFYNSHNVQTENCQNNQVNMNSPSDSALINSSKLSTQSRVITSPQNNKSNIESERVLRRTQTMLAPNQVQQHYQNVRQLFDDQLPTSDQLSQSRRSFIAKRDFFERLKSAPSAYDSPPRPLPTQKLTTTITTISNSRMSLDGRENVSTTLIETPTTPENLVQQNTETQQINSSPKPKRPESQSNLVVENCEQYPIIIDGNKREIYRTSSVPRNSTVQQTSNVPRTSIVQTTKVDSTKDFDSTKQITQFDRVVDDHEAIHKLTRALQDHNTISNTDLGRLPSTTSPILVNTTTTTTTTTTTAAIPTRSLAKNSLNKSDEDEFKAIDDLLNDSNDTNDEKERASLQSRFRTLVSNLKNIDYINFLKNKNRNRTTSIDFNDPDQRSSLLANHQRKTRKSKSKSKAIRKYTEYNVLDALLGIPLSPPLSPVFAHKYRHLFPRSTSSDYAVVIKNNRNLVLSNPQSDEFEKNLAMNVEQTGHFPHSRTYQSSTVKENGPLSHTKSVENVKQTETVTPRIIYRYIDENGRVLKVSSVPPSQLKEVKSLSTGNFHPRATNEISQWKSEVRSSRRDEEKTVNFNRNSTSNEKFGKNIHLTRKESLNREIWPNENRFSSSGNVSNLKVTKRIPIRSENVYSVNSEKNLNGLSSKELWSNSNNPNEHRYVARAMKITSDTDSTISEPFVFEVGNNSNGFGQTLPRCKTGSVSKSMHYDYPFGSVFNQSNDRENSSNKLFDRTFSPEPLKSRISRNYIEVFRGGDSKPTEIYSVPIDETAAFKRDSRFDRFQQEKRNHSKDLPSKFKSNDQQTIFNANFHQVSQEKSSKLTPSPDRDSLQLENFIRHSKSFDYRPLRNKLQREQNFNSNLLVDESDSVPSSSTKTYENQTSLSSPDENLTNSIFRTKMIAI